MNIYDIKIERIHREFVEYLRELDFNETLDEDMSEIEELSRRVEEFYEKVQNLEREFEELKSWYKHILS